MTKKIRLTPHLRWMISAVVAQIATDFVDLNFHWVLKAFIFIIFYNIGVYLIGELPPDRQFYQSDDKQA